MTDTVRRSDEEGDPGGENRPIVKRAARVGAISAVAVPVLMWLASHVSEVHVIFWR